MSESAGHSERNGKARAISPDGLIGYNIMVALRDYKQHVAAAVEAALLIPSEHTGPVPPIDHIAQLIPLPQVGDIAVPDGVDCLHLVIGDGLIQNGDPLIPCGLVVQTGLRKVTGGEDAVVQTVLGLGHIPAAGGLGKRAAALTAVDLIGQHQSLGDR